MSEPKHPAQHHVYVEIDDDVPTTPATTAGFRALREPDILAVMHAADAIHEGHWTMRCPAHQGGVSASLEVALKNGRYQLKCFYGCTPAEIIRAALDKLDDKCARCDATQIASVAVRRARCGKCDDAGDKSE